MDHFTHLLHTLQLAVGLLLGSYLCFLGMGDYFDQLPDVARGKLMVGLAALVFSVIYARTHLIFTVDALKLVAFPAVYVILCLGLNELLGGAFESWPLLTALFRY